MHVHVLYTQDAWCYYNLIGGQVSHIPLSYWLGITTGFNIYITPKSIWQLHYFIDNITWRRIQYNICSTLTTNIKLKVHVHDGMNNSTSMHAYHHYNVRPTFQSYKSSPISNLGLNILWTAAMIPKAMEPHPDTTTISLSLICPSFVAWIEQANGSTKAAWWGGTDFDICIVEINNNKAPAESLNNQNLSLPCVWWS